MCFPPVFELFCSVAAGTACDILVLHRRDLFSTLNDYPTVATLLQEFARKRLEERAVAEQRLAVGDTGEHKPPVGQHRRIEVAAG